MTELSWSEGAPRSVAYDDIYFSPIDGLDEVRAVYVEGCGLPDAWRGRDRFVVGELGFGTGLNVLALIDLWRRTRPSPQARLNLFSLEAHPLDREDAVRALAAWPQLGELAEPLLNHWPRGRRGFHRVDWPELGVVLDLVVDDVTVALEAWTGLANAWFLDGFAPARNPAMWTPTVLNQVAQRSAPDARAATFTVAGAVRRGLEAAGFEIARRPGYGAKRERLEARLTPASVETPRVRGAEPRASEPVAIVGGGIAGAALVRALRREGRACVLVEAQTIGAGASGNPAALVVPRLDAGFGAVARLHAHAFARAVQLITAEAPGSVIARGALQRERAPRDAARFAAVAAWEGFDPHTMQTCAADAVALALGEDPAAGALAIREALTIEPHTLLTAWIGETPIISATIAAIEAGDEGWRLLDGQGALVLAAPVVCLALGASLPRFAPAIELRSVRGQLEIVGGVALDAAPASGDGYAVPTREGLVHGGTHAQGDAGAEPRAADSALNAAELARRRPALARRLEGAESTPRASVRLATPDHTPRVGALPGRPGIYILGALGGRGFTLAPLLAEHVAALIAGAPSPLGRASQRLIDPARA